jgi:hypothetical protein
MTNFSWALERLIRLLRHEAETHADPIERAKYEEFYNLSVMVDSDVDDAVTEAKSIGVRNPAFEGDMVGWLDDDFDDDEDENDKDE